MFKQHKNIRDLFQLSPNFLSFSIRIISFIYIPSLNSVWRKMEWVISSSFKRQFSKLKRKQNYIFCQKIYSDLKLKFSTRRSFFQLDETFLELKLKPWIRRMAIHLLFEHEMPIMVIEFTMKKVFSQFTMVFLKTFYIPS